MKKFLFGTVFGILISFSIVAIAAIVYKASDVEFESKDESWKVTNVEEAINDLKDNYVSKKMLEAIINNDIKWDYGFTGSVQEFVAEYDGKYKVEAWGAQGGNYDASLFGGAGGYTAGDISLNKGDKLYVYVGSQPSGTSTNYTGGWNGGGNCPSGKDKDGRAGGGASDIRLVGGTWNNFESLKSRIMVAAGGGGAAYENSAAWKSDGGAGGGISGFIPLSMGSSASGNHGLGGSQTSAGKANNSTSATGYGSFGIGGNGISNDGGAGGGAGYYGGGGSNVCSGGAGGSSFVSGHIGCNAIKEESTSTNIVHSGQPNHYSGIVFTNTFIIDGRSSMPDYSSKNSMIGNKGNGHVRISLVRLD